MVIPAGEYKTDHVHIVPLVPQALEILKKIPKPPHGDYLLSSTGGRVPIQGCGASRDISVVLKSFGVPSPSIMRVPSPIRSSATSLDGDVHNQTRTVPYEYDGRARCRRS